MAFGFDASDSMTHVEKLFSDKEKFLKYAESGRYKRGGPAFHSYMLLMESGKEGLAANLKNDQFFERLYCTLALWGMHKDGKEGPKMTDYPAFKHSIEMSSALFLELAHASMRDYLKDRTVADTANGLFSSLSLLRKGDRLTANTKLMHFVLPDLTPPIDRHYTLWLFEKDYPKTPGGELALFKEIMAYFSSAADKWGLGAFFEPKAFQPSIPKMIDNAIIGYRAELEKNAER
ncbi:MAG: hypothetical protein NT051_03640 [Candidatus Micrarchaeota archaeon]|nr:hypothetical protein [Candidatus Micrarchaeota archaeon]